tara:strand:+ start:503 stop:625 length:123 start_codon:yes stop_codon:yes gene_type:complete
VYADIPLRGPKSFSEALKLVRNGKVAGKITLLRMLPKKLS